MKICTLMQMLCQKHNILMKKLCKFYSQYEIRINLRYTIVIIELLSHVKFLFNKNFRNSE